MKYLTVLFLSLVVSIGYGDTLTRNVEFIFKPAPGVSNDFPAKHLFVTGTNGLTPVRTSMYTTTMLSFPYSQGTRPAESELTVYWYFPNSPQGMVLNCPTDFTLAPSLSNQSTTVLEIYGFDDSYSPVSCICVSGSMCP